MEIVGIRIKDGVKMIRLCAAVVVATQSICIVGEDATIAVLTTSRTIIDVEGNSVVKKNYDRQKNSEVDPQKQPNLSMHLCV